MTAPQLLTSAWQHWTSPECVLERVRRLGPIGLDPAGNPNDVLAPTFEDEERRP